MEDIVLRVSPELLRSVAEQVQSVVGSMRGHFESVEEIAEKTRGYWNGDAGERGREGYFSFQDEINTILARLEKHSIDLLKIAGIYENTERTIAEFNSELQTDRIV